MKKKELIIQRDRAMECGKLFADQHTKLIEVLQKLIEDNLISDKKRIQEINELFEKQLKQQKNFDKRWLGR